MSHNVEYQNNFISGFKSIVITSCLTLESPYETLLRRDSYINPRDAILKITSNNNVDVVFNGIVLVNNGITEYGNITCRHIIFGHNTVCVISKINAVSIDVTHSLKVKYSINNNVMSFIGDEIKNIKKFFPNLIVKPEYVESDGSELICILLDNEEDPRMALNTSHKYYSAIINSDIDKKRYGNIGNIEFYFLTIGNAYDDYVLGRFLLKIIDCVQESAAALIKSANK